ncbi:hypothetical protein Tco_1010413, partial [Tanacetum coccineum]
TMGTNNDEADHHDPNIQDIKLWKRMGYDGEIDDMLRIRLREAGSDEEIFTSLQTKKIIKLILGGRAYSLTLLEFARRLGLYQAVELEEEGFNVYIEGGIWIQLYLEIDRLGWMGRMEIHQEAIERMEYRQSYHWDRYRGVFEHMAGVYNVPMQGAYKPTRVSAQPQYDQYYQLYPPPPPKYQQQQRNDDE